jgi:hypothetical protein
MSYWFRRGGLEFGAYLGGYFMGLSIKFSQKKLKLQIYSIFRKKLIKIQPPHPPPNNSININKIIATVKILY